MRETRVAENLRSLLEFAPPSYICRCADGPAERIECQRPGVGAHSRRPFCVFFGALHSLNDR